MNNVNKMDKIKYIIILSFVLFFLFSCEKEIHLNLPDYVPKIVMNGILSPDSLIEIGISKSFLYTDTTSGKSMLKNALLTLFINGEKRESLQFVRIDTTSGYDRLSNYYYGVTSVYRSSVIPKTGDKIRIEASADGFSTVWAETTLPLPPTIHQIDTVTFFTTKRIVNGSGFDPYAPYSPEDYRNIIIEEKYRNMKIKMSVGHHSQHGKPHFAFQVRTMVNRSAGSSASEENYLYFYTNDDPVFKEYYRNNILEEMMSDLTSFDGIKYPNFVFFSDKLFKDKRYTLDFSVTDYYSIQKTYLDYWENPGDAIYNYNERSVIEVVNPPIDVIFTAVSPELHAYFRTRGYDPDDDIIGFKMFSEQETTFSNVHNGIGIVGAVSPTKAQIIVPPFPGGKNCVPRLF